MSRKVVALAMATMLAVAFSGPVEAADPIICGDGYACGQILVSLKADTTDLIADVLARHGGTPSDIEQSFEGVRDLLLIDAQDLRDTTWYVITVPIGQELAKAAEYAADSAVDAAGVDRETVGYIDGAMREPSRSPLPLIGLTLLVLAAVAATAQVFRSMRT